MTDFPGLRRIFRLAARRPPIESEIDEEMAFHLQSRRDELIRQGVAPSDAEAAARREFGDTEVAKVELGRLQRSRIARSERSERLADLVQDLRHAARRIRRQPGFAFVVVSTMSVGIGVAAAVVNVARSAFTRSLPFPEADRLVHLFELQKAAPGEPSSGGRRTAASYPNFADLRTGARTLTALEGYNETNVTAELGEATFRLRGVRVTPGFFEMLGVRPLHGATLAGAGEAQVAVITHGFWTRHLGANPGAVGTSLRLDGGPYTVVGILPPEFQFAPAGGGEVWLPIPPSVPQAAQRQNSWLSLVGRLGTGVTVAQARAELGTVMARLAESYPETNLGRGVEVVGLRDEVVGPVKPILLLLLGAVSLLLLIACANVATLYLAQGLGRQHETAIRLSLGAGRWRVARQAMTESVLLALVGGVGALV
ncbi:MAG: hypothetical protein HOP28_04940, partial [Gemmatimonadales bacterium]|nr:hypothetical protein [Gemmatimonadales bacterium]